MRKNMIAAFLAASACATQPANITHSPGQSLTQAILDCRAIGIEPTQFWIVDDEGRRAVIGYCSTGSGFKAVGGTVQRVLTTDDLVAATHVRECRERYFTTPGEEDDIGCRRNLWAEYQAELARYRLTQERDRQQQRQNAFELGQQLLRGNR